MFYRNRMEKKCTSTGARPEFIEGVCRTIENSFFKHYNLRRTEILISVSFGSKKTFPIGKALYYWNTTKLLFELSIFVFEFINTSCSIDKF